jgi:hypothetical protein
VRGAEDDRGGIVAPVQFLLQLEAAEAGHPDIDDDDTGLVQIGLLQEGGGGGVGQRVDADALQQEGQRLTQVLVVVDDMDDGGGRTAHARRFYGDAARRVARVRARRIPR